LEKSSKNSKNFTEIERLILIIETLQEEIDFSDEEIKKALSKLDDKILPKSFPTRWGGKHKISKDPTRPKPPSNAYIYFTIAVRPSVEKANPELSNTEIVSLMAKMWNETAENDRGEYKAKALEDKNRYEAQMKVYETKNPEKARASTKIHDKQTKATAHRMFCDENRQHLKDENPELDGRDIIKMLGELWNEIKEDSEQFAKYQELADETNKAQFGDTSPSPVSSSSPKKLSASEQAKADQPDKYEFNTETNRYVLKKNITKTKEPESEPEIKANAKANAKAKVTSKIKTKESESKPEIKAKEVPKPKIQVQVQVDDDDDDDDLLFELE